jgi:hypothetical protein
LYGGLGPRVELEEKVQHSKEDNRGSVESIEGKQEV